MPIEVRQTETYARWIAGLDDDRARARIEVRIFRLSLGNAGDVRPAGKALVILLCGGDKRTQRKDITTAQALARQLKE
jgi:putative component of toxin-antitoxin plasmid stabilization module